jgi:hypothetical protein
VIFETKVDWWSEVKLVTRDLVIKYNSEEPTAPAIPSNFVESDKEKQLEILELTPENEQAEKIGFVIGSLDLNVLDPAVQDFIWKLEKKNHNFASGLGSAIGNNLPLFDKETRNRLLDKGRGNTSAFLRSFGDSIGGSLYRFEDDALRKFTTLMEEHKADFARGLITRAGNNFESTPETVREQIWVTSKENSTAANDLGQALGLSFFSMGVNTRRRIWKESRYNNAFASGLGLGLGKRFSSSKKEDRAQILDAVKPELMLEPSFVQSLARALGEDFSILEGEKRLEIWNKVRQNDTFAETFGEALRQHYSELDEETEQETIEVANEVPSFKRGYRTK